LDFDGIVAGWDIEEKEKIAKKERKCATLHLLCAEPHIRLMKCASISQNRIKITILHQIIDCASNRKNCIKSKIDAQWTHENHDHTR
jgi:hypothetical protein